jgi:hypothetical protein
MTDFVPSLTDPDGTTPIDPTAVSVGEVYLLTTEDDGDVEITITDVQHGTDDAGDPVPTVISYQHQATDTSTSGG